MKGIMRKYIYGASVALVMSTGVLNAVPVHINSGNPAYPFPQFLEYASGDNLGTKNPEGVVHIEMEQDIRDAYQIFANEWEYTGDVMDGVKYIRGNIGCPYDCREGDGYSMLAAAVMGDKDAFDGLWFRIHDSFRPGSTSYMTGAKIGGGEYGNLIIGDQNNNCSATDGDNEIVLALYIAWRQWGDDSGHKGANGEAISYKKDMIEVTRGLVALYEERFKTENPRRVTTGDVGLDGYLKNGTTWPEVTGWGNANPTVMNGVDYIPEYKGPVNMHTDYSSPAYFREFYDLIMALDLPESSEWEREQYRRCEASCDWMVGNWLSQSAKNLFFGEEASISANNVVTLEAGNQGGRFRSAWRTALNYVWHGNPTYTWDPVSHTVKNGGNTFEKDWCDRFAEFMNDPQGWDKSASCTEFGGGPELTYKGPGTLHWDIGPDGSFPKSEFIFNWVAGVGMPAAIGSGDLELSGLLYRTCNIEWDITEGGDGYLSSKPHYFHGFFRWLGMLIATGNHQAPSVMKPSANMKIYRAIEDSVTFAYTGDELTYLLDYRNFGTVDAKNVVIVENVPADFVFVSASDGGKYDAGSHTITWNIGTVAGFKSDESEGPALNLKGANLSKTMGQVSYKCKIGPNAFGRYCTTADITCSNGTGWTTNEYPNYVTATMQRNCVDVIKRALKIEKTSDVEKVNPGNLVEYKINFENSSEAGWLDGGRPRVNIGISNSGLGTSQQWLRFRLYNDAIEPYINYGNYRIAYYMYDAGLDCLAGEEDCPNGWGWYTAIYEGKRSAADKVNVTHETIVEGSDDYGKWNQRMCIQFAPLLVTTTAHLSNYYGMGSRIHKGGTEPLRVAGYLYPSNWASTNFADDWSWDAKAEDAEDGNYHPVSPSWQTIDPETGKSVEIPVTEYLPSVCEKPTHVVKNILVEEYDGYVWRRILGTGPMAGREARDVVVIDTLPKGMEFVDFMNDCPLAEYGASWDKYQIADGRWVVKWEIPIMQVKQKGSIIYTAMASFPSGAECETDDELTTNVAWILAEKNSPLSDTAEVTVTCAKVPKPILPTTLVKTVDKEKVQIGDDVTYTIEYEQTHGAIFDDALENVSDWTANGSAMKNGMLTISQNSSASFKNSLSKNIYVEFDANIAQDQESEIVLRDNIHIKFKYNSSNGMNITCLDGTKEVEKATVALKNNPSRWKIRLQDDILQMWFGKDTSAGAAFTASGLTEKEGKLSFNGIGWGEFKYSNMHVHTDYAYDLTIVDNKPEEITFGSADEGGKLVGDSIVWEFEHGMNKPIPYGKKYTVTWTGTVDACNEVLINQAYAQLLGHSDDEIRAQATSECIDDACEGVQKAELTIKDSEICAGDSTVLKAVGSPKSSKYEYEFFLGNTSLGDATTVDSFIVKEMGDYKVKISDPSCPTANPASSKTVSLIVNALPDEEITDKAVICENEALKLGDVAVDDHTIEWYGDKNKTIVVDAEDIPAEDVRNTYFYVLTSEATGCKGELKEWDVTINEVPSTPTVKPEKELPLKDGVSENITNMASASESGNYVVWYKSEDAAIKDSVKAPILVDLSNAGKVTYYVREKSPEGCIGDLVPVSVLITSSQKPNPNDTTICVGEEIDVTTLVEAEEGNTLIWYDENGDEMDAPEKYTSEEAGVKEFSVAQTNGTAVSDKSTFTVTTVAVSDLKEDVINYCAGEEAVKLTAKVDAANCATCKMPTSYNWYLKGQPTTDLTPETNVTSTRMYDYEVEPVYEISKGHVCVGKKVSVEVNVEFVPAVMPDHAIHYTLSDAVDGKFPTLIEQDPTAVSAALGNKLVWYDANGNEIGDKSPSPEMVTDDATVTYQVKQVNKEGCASELQDVTVIITKTPVPATTIAYYCDGDTPDPIEQFAKVTDSGYSLIWYDGDPKKGGTQLSSAPAIDVTTTPGEPETIRQYYVAQGNDTETSSANVVEVHIFSNPELITRDSASCEKPVDINGLWSDISKKVEFTTFYTAFGSTLGQDEIVTSSGTYRVEGSFNVGVAPNIKECKSTKAPIVVEIHTLGSVEIEGADAVCPNTAVELNIKISDEEIFDSTLTYVWNKPNNASAEKEFVSDPIKAETKFSVTISDGVCKKTFDKTVSINTGKIDGNIEISEDDNENSPVKMNATADGTKFHSCGGDVKIVADVVGSEFVWDDGTEGNTITRKGGVYKVSYKDANGCTTGFSVEISPNPIKDNTVRFDTTLCEGENVTLVAALTAGTEKPDVVWKKDGDEISNEASLVLKKVTAAEAGEYTYEATNRGCKADGTFGTLTILPRPTYTIKDVEVVCAGESEEIGLESLTPTTAEVEWAENPTLVSTGNTAVVTPEADETYSFTISQNGGCKITEKITVKVAQPIEFSINANDTTVCEYNAGNLRFGLKVVSGDVMSYEWTDSKDSVVSTSSVLRFNEKEIGTYKYTVKLTSEACPSATDDIEVRVAGTPMIETINKIDYHNIEIVPSTEVGEAPFEYRIDANEFSSSEEVRVNYGHHTAVIKDVNGCTSSYEFDTEAPEFEIPSVITPNGDGTNDGFISQVIAEAYPDAKVTIFDRYGKKLAEIKGDEAWDGTYLGKKMPSTDYWYEIWIDEIRKKYVGHFTLIND